MKYTGLVLEESLKDKSVLNSVTVVKTETWNVGNAEGNQPKVWHAVSIEGPQQEAGKISEMLSRSLKSPGWYTNLSTDSDIYVIFPDKVFEYQKGDQEKRNQAIEYGRKIGIPESQLDWSE